MMTIQNVPAYAYSYTFIVARYVDGEYWFWEAYNDGDTAYTVAVEVDGEVFCTVDVQ